MNKQKSLHRIGACALLGAFLAVEARGALKPIEGKVLPSEGKATFIYKTTPEGELKIYVYFPSGWKASDHRPAIVFFFGGEFRFGSPTQFAPAAGYLARRGMVAAAADYRVRNRQHTSPDKSIEDAKSAVRWMRSNARKLGIDPNRLAAGGGSAGATCAAFTAYNSTYEPHGEDTAISEVPDALVLLNPALGFSKDSSRYNPQMVRATGTIISYWKVRKGGPPAIVFYGSEDRLGIEGRGFVSQMIAAGNRAELFIAPGQKHGFFNPVHTGEQTGRPLGAPGWYEATLYQTDLFLESLGYLKGKPTITRIAGVRLKKELP
jgi:acetyl esterase